MIGEDGQSLEDEDEETLDEEEEEEGGAETRVIRRWSKFSQKPGTLNQKNSRPSVSDPEKEQRDEKTGDQEEFLEEEKTETRLQEDKVRSPKGGGGLRSGPDEGGLNLIQDFHLSGRRGQARHPGPTGQRAARQKNLPGFCRGHV